MAKRQTRRGVSLNRMVYNAAKRAADQQGKSLAHFVVDALRAAGVDLPATTHAQIADVRRAAKTRSRLPQDRLAPKSASALSPLKKQPRREGPIRRALGDEVADRIGEP